MSTFQIALAEFLRLQALENRIRDDEAALAAATEVTDDAFDGLIALPAETLGQAAAKLAALASHYDVPTCGCDRQGWAMLVGEMCRFAALEAAA